MGGLGVTASTLWFPSDVSVSGSQMVVADGYNRVLLIIRFQPRAALGHMVLGQPNMTSDAAGVPMTGVPTTTMLTLSSPNSVWTKRNADRRGRRKQPAGIALERLAHGERRAAKYRFGSAGFHDKCVVDRERGFGELACHSLGRTSNGTELHVSDNGNNRVLLWENWPTTNQQPPISC